jgi:hypothetical protein
MLSADADADNQQAIVFALGKSGIIRDAVPQPNHHLLLSGGVTGQLSETTTISVRPSYEDVTNGNRGVGGVTLASAGANFEHREEQITYTQQTIVNPALVNQFQFLVGQEREPTTSVSPDRGIVVDGAFTGGGAQSDLLRTERHFQLTLALDAFNVANRVNYASYVGTQTSRLFGQPVTARAPRQLQVSARIKF